MIRATFAGTTLSLRGHAGSAPRGQDLVCAAVTGLVYALAQRIRELDAQAAFEEPPLIKLASGDASVCVVARKTHTAVVAEDFRLLQAGLRLLAQQYPRQVQVTEVLDENRKGNQYE